MTIFCEMEIQTHGRGVFIVTSHTEQFTVDVCCHHGNGRCDCFHFLKHIQKAIDEDMALGTFTPHDRYRCPHLKFARQHLCDAFIQELIKQFPDNKLE